MSSDGQKRSSRDTALVGWRSRLAAFMSAALVIQAATGVWMYIGPFSAAAQVQVLLHVGVGLLMVVPFCAYQWDHFNKWFRQRATAEMFLGYALGICTIVCIVSGLWLTWESAVGPRMSPVWDLVHLTSGLAVPALLIAHILTAAIRRPGAVDPELAVARRGYARRGMASVGFAVVVVAGGALVAPGDDFTRAVPADYDVPEYVADNPLFAGNPFAPSNARTEGDLLIDSSLLSGSDSCGTSGCHEEVLAEWQPSAHRFAAMNAPFRAVQRAFADDRSAADTRYCAGCHDPISLFAGAKDVSNQDLAAPGMQEGISCVGCHSISHADERGNADYVLTPPRKYFGEGTMGWRKAVSDFLIRAYPRQHLVDYDRNLLRTPEFCAACHKQFIPEELNNFGLVPGQNQYDEWLNAHWHSDDPETDLSCTDCHMRLVYDSRDPGHGEGGEVHRDVDDGAHRHHGFIATNNFMPAVLDLPHQERHVALTEEWIRGETVLPEIDDRWPRGPVATVELSRVPESVEAGGELELRAVVVNRKAGHNFITGPLDFVRSWVHLTVKDVNGNVLVERGGIDPESRRILDRPGHPHTEDSELDPTRGTLVLEANPIDAEGRVIEKHELWRKAGGRDKRVVFPRYTAVHTYRLEIPADAEGPLTIDAALLYRRYRQRFLDLVVPDMERESGVYQRTVEQSRTSVTVDITPRDVR